MKVTFHQTKRDETLANRGLDFADAVKVFEGRTLTTEDTRFDYGETRLITAGWLDGRIVVLVWTPRGAARHIISMRHCHGKEEKRIIKALG